LLSPSNGERQPVDGCKAAFLYQYSKKETKMRKNRFLLVLGVISLLLVTLAVSKPFSGASPERLNEATDFHQRHPDWTWKIGDQEAVTPLAGDLAFSDYYPRHPELRIPVEIVVDTTDYFIRHPDLRVSAKSVDLTDYFLRHPELRNP
jgi:hypothetical protein